MKEITNRDWLEGQTMNIPIEEYINLKISISQYIDEKKRLVAALDEATTNLKSAKAQIRELLEIKEVKPDADNG